MTMDLRLRLALFLCLATTISAYQLDQELCTYKLDEYAIEWAYEPITKNVVFLLKVENTNDSYWTGVGIGKRNEPKIDFIFVTLQRGQIGIADSHISHNGSIVPDHATNVQSINFNLDGNELTAKFARALNSTDDEQDQDLSGCTTLYFPTLGGEISPDGIVPDFNMMKEKTVCNVDKNCLIDLRRKLEASNAVHNTDLGFRRDDAQKTPEIAHSVDISGTGDPCSFKGANYSVNWTYVPEKDAVDFVMHIPVKHGRWWSAVGIGDNMNDMDIGIIFVEDGNVRRMLDYYSNSYSEPSRDSLQDWKLYKKRSMNNGTELEIYFSRKLDTDDIEKDRSLSGCVLFQFAANLGKYGPNYAVEKHEDWPDLYKACDLKSRCQVNHMEKRGQPSGLDVQESIDDEGFDVEKEEEERAAPKGKNKNKKTTTPLPTTDESSATGSSDDFLASTDAGVGASLPDDSSPPSFFGASDSSTDPSLPTDLTSTIFGLNPIFDTTPSAAVEAVDGQTTFPPGVVPLDDILASTSGAFGGPTPDLVAGSDATMGSSSSDQPLGSESTLSIDSTDYTATGLPLDVSQTPGLGLDSALGASEASTAVDATAITSTSTAVENLVSQFEGMLATSTPGPLDVAASGQPMDLTAASEASTDLSEGLGAHVTTTGLGQGPAQGPLEASTPNIEQQRLDFANFLQGLNGNATTGSTGEALTPLPGSLDSSESTSVASEAPTGPSGVFEVPTASLEGSTGPLEASTLGSDVSFGPSSPGINSDVATESTSVGGLTASETSLGGLGVSDTTSGTPAASPGFDQGSSLATGASSAGSTASSGGSEASEAPTSLDFGLPGSETTPASSSDVTVSSEGTTYTPASGLVGVSETFSSMASDLPLPSESTLGASTDLGQGSESTLAPSSRPLDVSEGSTSLLEESTSLLGGSTSFSVASEAPSALPEVSTGLPASSESTLASSSTLEDNSTTPVPGGLSLETTRESTPGVIEANLTATEASTGSEATTLGSLLTSEASAVSQTTSGSAGSEETTSSGGQEHTEGGSSQGPSDLSTTQEPVETTVIYVSTAINLEKRTTSRGPEATPSLDGASSPLPEALSTSETIQEGSTSSPKVNNEAEILPRSTLAPKSTEVEGSGQESTEDNPFRAEAEASRTGGKLSSSLENTLKNFENENRLLSSETRATSRPIGGQVSVNNGRSETVMAVSGQPANLTSCTRGGDLPICDKYMDDYIDKVKTWAVHHKETLEEQYPKACTLLANVPHVPSMCCVRFWQTCTGFLSAEDLAKLGTKKSMGRS